MDAQEYSVNFGTAVMSMSSAVKMGGLLMQSPLTASSVCSQKEESWRSGSTSTSEEHILSTLRKDASSVHVPMASSGNNAVAVNSEMTLVFNIMM